MQDTIEMFSEKIGDLHELYEDHVRPAIHANRAGELRKAPDALFGKPNDSIREAALVAGDRKLSPETLRETSLKGLQEVFR